MLDIFTRRAVVAPRCSSGVVDPLDGWYCPRIADASVVGERTGDTISQDADGWIDASLIESGNRLTPGDWTGTNGGIVVTWPAILASWPSAYSLEAYLETTDLAVDEQVGIGYGDRDGEQAELGNHHIAWQRRPVGFNNRIGLIQHTALPYISTGVTTTRNLYYRESGIHRNQMVVGINRDTRQQGAGNGDPSDETMVRQDSSSAALRRPLVLLGCTNTAATLRVRPWFRIRPVSLPA